MPADHRPTRESVHRCAFLHYLRTGQRLTSEEWLARHEKKFNPYHDELGRFTSPPGVTVSYGRHGPTGPDRPSGRRRPADSSGSGDFPLDRRRKPAGRARAIVGATLAPTSASTSASTQETVDAAISREWSPEAPIHTRFDLNRRQFHLDTLRQKAGPNPSLTDREAFQETQRRLDAARTRLDERDRIADREVLAIFRTGAPPIDIIAGGINIASGDAELGDYLAVAGVVPLGGTVSKIGKVAGQAAKPAVREIVQLGGAYHAVRQLRGYHAHHIPPKSVSPLSKSRGPSIAMLPADHRSTLSYGWGAASIAHRKVQADLIAKGEFRKAQQMDIDDIQTRFGSKYDTAIEQMLEYGRKVGL